MVLRYASPAWLLQVILICAGSGCSYTVPYSSTRAQLAGVEGDTLAVLMERDTGTMEHEILSPCPKDRENITKRTYYVLQYNLDHPAQPPARTEEIFERSSLARDGLLPETSVETMRRTGRLPTAVQLYLDATPGICYRPAIADDVKKELDHLGFDTKHEVLSATTPEGTWYLSLGFQNPLVQVCCPARNFIAQAPTLAADYRSIWNAGAHRLVVLGSEDRDVTIWDYDRATPRSIKLARP